ncbi:hypothetical protein [Nostoc sp.]
MAELSCAINLKIRLIYYPPYHSKYNSLLDRYPPQYYPVVIFRNKI